MESKICVHFPLRCGDRLVLKPRLFKLRFMMCYWSRIWGNICEKCLLLKLPPSAKVPWFCYMKGLNTTKHVNFPSLLPIRKTWIMKWVRLTPWPGLLVRSKQNMISLEGSILTFFQGGGIYLAKDPEPKKTASDTKYCSSWWHGFHRNRLPFCFCCHDLTILVLTLIRSLPSWWVLVFLRGWWEKRGRHELSSIVFSSLSSHIFSFPLSGGRIDFPVT